VAVIVAPPLFPLNGKFGSTPPPGGYSKPLVVLAIIVGPKSSGRGHAPGDLFRRTVERDRTGRGDGGGACGRPKRLEHLWVILHPSACCEFDELTLTLQPHPPPPPPTPD